MITTTTPIQIRAGDLKPVIVGLGKVIAKTATLPALHCVKVEALNSKTMQLTATDLDTTLRIEVPASMDAKMAPFLLPLAHLRDRIKGHKADDPVLLEPPKKGVPVSEFPELPTFRAAPIPLQNNVATSLLRAFACASTDTTRYVLQGAFLDTGGTGPKSHRFVATDGRHLFSSNSLDLPKVKKPVILPDHKLWKWKPIAESRPWTLRLGTASKGGPTPYRIDGPFWTVSGTCIDGNYPNYKQVIPPASDFKTSVEIPEEVGAAIAELIPKLPGKKLDNSPVGIRVDKGLVSLLAKDSLGEPWRLYPIGKASVKGPDFTTFAKRRYVGRAFQFGLTRLQAMDEMSPLQFSREGDLMIVMPLRVDEPNKVEHRKNAKPVVGNRSIQPASPAKEQPRSKPTPPLKKKVAKKKPATKRASKRDPLNEAESRIAEANQALRSVGKELKSATGSLKKVRKQRSADQQELSGFRSLLRSIKRFGKSNDN